jgi:hypothetical protein
MSEPILPVLPGSLDARFPVLLLPVSVQVKFVHTATTKELLVRIYPDQLGISTHEGALTAAEQAAGKQYWELAPIAPKNNPSLHDLDHWRALVARFGAARSQWILRQTTPPAYRNQVPNLPAEPLITTDTRWRRPAEARGLPDHFSVLLYSRVSDGGRVADGPVKKLFYPAGSGRSYAADKVPHPTTEFLQLYKTVNGRPLPNRDHLAVGLNPNVEPDPAGIGGVDAGNKWTVDFAEAEAQGMAVRIDLSALSAAEYARGFARLVVLGVRTDAATPGQPTGHTVVQQLLSEHYYTSGVQLVPQGTPTNNTDAVAAGYSSRELTDAEATFRLLSQPADFDLNTPWRQRPDGQHLASALGLAAGTVPPLAGALAHDTSEALALNRALWPATYGYFLEEMLRPLLSPAALNWTRHFFETYVLARGVAPALRVGSQPYGLLPTTRFSVWEVDARQANAAYAAQLQQVLGQLDATWTERLNPQAGLYSAAVGVTPPATTSNLLTTLGLDATSTEYYQRYLIGPIMAEALNTYAQTPTSDEGPLQIWTNAARTNGRYDPTQNLLYREFAQLLDPNNTAGLQRTAAGQPVAAPPIFGQTFQSTLMKLVDAFADEPGARRAEGVLLDDQPLSEITPVAPFQGLRPEYAGLNYISWLATASFDDIRLENFTSLISTDPRKAADFAPPTALFYYLLRQAVLLEYWAAAKAYWALNDPNFPAASDLADDELFNILTPNEKPRWAWLYDKVGNEELYKVLRTPDSSLDTYLKGVGQLASRPTARLERLLAEHLDLGSYRLDAWRLAPVIERLTKLRLRENTATATGSHLGAFGWLEDLKPADRSVGNDDPDNLGYIHAPSLVHGTTAAILRQGYKSRQLTADPADPAARRMAVNLSSRRVRAALALLDGLRAGHSLGTLLGQSFERALQQHGGTAGGRPYGSYVSLFRQAFPLAGEHASTTGATTAAPQGVAPEQAMRQVMDGAAFLRTAATRQTYPYGLAQANLPLPDSEFARFVASQVAQLTDDLDALGDLAVSEGIFQAARGNTDRAAAVLESVAKGQFPLAPDIVHPPQQGFTLTQRVLIQLPADTTVQQWPGVLTPRAEAAPRLNAWLAQFFPKPEDVRLEVGYSLAEGAWQLLNDAATLLNAALHPIDLLYVLDEQALQAGSAFDQLLLYKLGQPHGPAPTGARVAINYRTSPGVAALRQRLPLLARLRQLLSGARPARPHDLQAPGRLADDNEDTGTRRADLARRLTEQQTRLANLEAASTALTPDQYYQATLYGITEALPGLNSGTDLATLAPLVKQAIRTRLTAATAALQSVAPITPFTVAAHLGQAAALFGPTFRPDVEFTLAGDASDAAAGPAARDAYLAATTAQAVSDLLRHVHDQPLALQEWLHGVGAVREPMNHLDKVLLIQSLLQPDAAPGLPLQPAQLTAPVEIPAGSPPPPPAYWLGLPWPNQYTPPADALSLVQWLPEGYSSAGVQCALWVDEWVENIPQAQQPTALTFHYDQPNSEAPQTMLLVVSPYAQPSGAWTAADLLGAVNETLDLAKKRTVEPDALAFTPLATVLPAVVAPVAQQAVTLTLDLGRVNNTANFSEEPLAL